MFIVGAGAHGRVVLDILRRTDVPVLGFFDDDPQLQGKSVNGVTVQGGVFLSWSEAGPGIGCVIAIGDNVIRGRIGCQLEEQGVTLVNAIHPSAVLAADVQLVDGVVIMAGVVVNTGSCIAKGACVNTRASLDHDNVIGEYANVFPGAVLTGGCRVEQYATVGSGAVVLPYVTVGENAYVGAGAVIREDVPANAVAVGVPARIVSYREPLPGSLG